MSAIDYSIVISAVSVIVVGWTAIETLRMRRAAVEQNELQLLPFLAIYVRGERIKDRKFRIRNSGYGVAFDIQIEPLVIETTKKTSDKVIKTYELHMELEDVNVLTVDEEHDLMLRTFLEGEELKGWGLGPYIDPAFATASPIFRILFRNARGHRYYTVIQLGKGGVKIIEPPKRLRWYKRFKPFSLCLEDNTSHFASGS